MNISCDNYENCMNLRDELMDTYKDNAELISFEMQPLFDYGNKEYADIMSVLFKRDFASGLNGKNMGNQLVTSNLPLLHSILYKIPVSPKYTKCSAQTYNRVYDSEGNVYGCIVSVGNPKKALGTYYPEYVLYKENTYLSRNIETVKECKECIYAFYCGGGCADAATEIYGNCMNPECERFKYLTYDFMPQAIKCIFK